MDISLDHISLDTNKQNYFITVPHTGTHSVRMMLDQMAIEYRFSHFEKIPEITIDDVIDDYNIITTYRDPFEVAASWANRLPYNALRKRRFKGSWTRWGLVVPHAVKVITIDEMTQHRNRQPGDRSGAATALIEENWERYFQIVPREVVEHAYSIAHAAGYASPYEVALL